MSSSLVSLVVLHLFLIISVMSARDSHCMPSAKIFWKLMKPLFKEQRTVTLPGVADDSSLFTGHLMECLLPVAVMPIIYYKSKLDLESIRIETERYRKDFVRSAAHGYIYISESVEFLTYRLRQASIVDATAQTVFVLHSNKKASHEDVTLLLMRSWIEFKMLNVIGVLFIEKQNRTILSSFYNDTNVIPGKFLVSIYDPFVIKYKARGYVYRHEVTESNFGEITRIVRYILESRLNDVRRYPLRVCIFESPGIAQAIRDARGEIKGIAHVDGELLNALLEKFNFEPVYVFPENGSTYGKRVSGRATGALGVMVRGEADITGNIRPVIDYSNSDVVEFIASSDDVGFWFVVPEMGTSNNLPVQAFFSIFNYRTSIALTFIYLVIVLTWWCLQKLSSRYIENPNRSDDNMANCSLERISFISFGALIMAAVQISLTRRFETILYIFTVLFATIVSTVYVGSMVGLLSNSKYSLNIETLDELAASDLSIATTTNYVTLLNTSSEDKTFQELFRRHRIIDNEMDAVKKVIHNRNMAVLVHEPMAKIMWAREVSETTNRSALHVIKDGPPRRDRAHMVQRQSPYRVAFHNFIQDIRESGIIKFWKDRQYHEILMKAKIREGLLTKDQVSSFSMHELKIIFALLMFCLGVCALVFLGELVTGRIQDGGEPSGNCDKADDKELDISI